MSTKAKLTKTATKRSAPVQPQPSQQYGGEGGTITVPVSSELGLLLLNRRKRANDIFSILFEHGSNIRASRADAAADAFAETLSYLPPTGAIEALAAVILIHDDLDMMVAGATEAVRNDARAAAERRVASVSEWIEKTCRIDRREHGFKVSEDRVRLLPHTATAINAGADHDS